MRHDGKPKQLNKSFENAMKKKKNLSSSPKRSNSKKSAKSAQRKKDPKSQIKGLVNMRDLNSFMKNFEKGLAEKFDKQLNMKDFNSMPTTP